MSRPLTVENPTNGSEVPSGPDEVRATLREGGGHEGFVDGAWWPRTRDLRAELPTLLDWLEPRVGEVERVAFGMSGWDAVDAHRLATTQGRIRLEGFRSVEQATVWFVVRGSGRSRVGLVVVPPDTAPGTAEETMRRASATDNRQSPADLLVDTASVTA